MGYVPGNTKNSLEWRNVLPHPLFIEKRFTSLGLHFFRVAHEDVKHIGSLPDGYIICYSTGAQCLLTHKTEYGEQSARFLKGDINVTPPCKELEWKITGEGGFTCLYASKFYIN